MLENACAGLFLDPGLGKTSITLAAAKVLKREKLVKRILIIAPLRVCYLVWPNAASKWDDLNRLKIAMLHGEDKEKAYNSDADIFLINPEGLPWLAAKKKHNFDMLVVDESTKFKTTNSQRFKLLKTMLPAFRRRYILTGTPAPNGLMDIFGQIFILDLGAALGSFITHYRNTYFYPTGFGGYDWKLQEGAEKRIQERIKPLTLRLEAKDHLELPQLIESTITLQLPPKLRKLYKEMEQDLFATLRKGDVSAANAAVASMKCCQIANGGIFDEGGKIHQLHMIKAEAVAERIEELQGMPALVAYEFEHDLLRLQQVLGKKTPYIGGGVTPKRSQEIEQAWNRGDIPVLLAQPASISHGLNLQNAGNRVLWHSLIWNFENYDQFNKRVLRQGSKHSHVFVDHFVMDDTVDEAKVMSLKTKDNTQRSLLNGLKDYMIKKS